VETGPELVVADQSLPGTVSTGRADDPSGPALTVPTNQGTQRAETTAQDHPSRPSETSSGGQTASDQRSQSAVHSSQSHQSAGDEAHESVPLSLDRLEKPTLDRFVEQISDELARHDRIERERRGL